MQQQYKSTGIPGQVGGAISNISLKRASLVVAALSLTACTVMPSDTANAIITVPEIESPLDEFIGAWQSLWTNQAEFERAAAEHALHREQLIAECMWEAGFTYEHDLRNTITSARFDGIQANDREWVSRHGFGIVAGLRLGGNRGITFEDDNPNREYIAALSETAREAWDIALNGPAEDLGPADRSRAGWNEYMLTRGCAGQAEVQAQLASPLFALSHNAEFAALFDAIDGIESIVRDQPEWARLNADWSHCMADAGYPGLNTPTDALVPFVNEYASTRVMIHLQQQNGTPNAEGGAALLADLQAREIAIALTDFDCRLTTNYDARAAELRFDMETQFVNDNRALLEDFRNAAELAGE